MPPRTVALTFDDGPDPTWTPRILDVLAKHNVNATFFMVGAEAAANPQLVRRVRDAGHEIGSHTYTHADIGALPAWRTDLEMSLTDNALAGAAGIRPRLLRPPYSSVPAALCGATWDAVRRTAHAGYLIVATDLDSKDWARPGAAAIAAASTPQDGRGAVVMFHDGGGDRAQTVEGLDLLLTELAKQDYRFTTISEGIGLPPTPTVDTQAEWRGTALIWAQQGAHAFALAEERALAWTEAPESLQQLWRQRYRLCYGTLQAMWKHRRAVFDRGPAGHLGRRGLPYLFLFQVLLPLLAPVVDVFALYGLVFLDPWRMLGIWLAFLATQMLTAVYALRLDKERLGPIWTLPLQQFVYRQLMYLVVIQSVVTAVLGNRLRWQRMQRTGTAGEQLARAGTPAQ
ncbi:bifunctional polysaccharide deacetylase/glycosyltransferase family 2 protein [Yinghuangia sp. YIM S10712]|uniref:bifunctional polysaccharide deacetylase/glycosyltransferase family 2 protein n=1 Tax=Yinghuangia sp. YIM S10712 TaxID=3436930 RepID=UPI003F52E2D5